MQLHTLVHKHTHTQSERESEREREREREEHMLDEAGTHPFGLVLCHVKPV
jgi:hypothetical protein